MVETAGLNVSHFTSNQACMCCKSVGRNETSATYFQAFLFSCLKGTSENSVLTAFPRLKVIALERTSINGYCSIPTTEKSAVICVINVISFIFCCVHKRVSIFVR